VTDSQVHRERAKEERRQRKQVEARAAEADRLAELIEAMEGRLAGLGDELSQASAAQDTRRVEALGREYQAVDERLHQLMEEWAEWAS
jgi:predicted  nucleic acid-binding Zn-ribbon protein